MAGRAEKEDWAKADERAKAAELSGAGWEARQRAPIHPNPNALGNAITRGPKPWPS